MAGLVGDGLVAGGPGRGGDGTKTGGCPVAPPEAAPAGDVGETIGTSVPLGDWVAASEPGVTALGAVAALPPPEPALPHRLLLRSLRRPSRPTTRCRLR